VAASDIEGDDSAGRDFGASGWELCFDRGSRRGDSAANIELGSSSRDEVEELRQGSSLVSEDQLDAREFEAVINAL
jgi:hypothetical protein